MKSHPFGIKRKTNELTLNQGGYIELDGINCRITSIKRIKVSDGMIEVIGMAKEIVKGDQK